jgi:hypothetical protein
MDMYRLREQGPCGVFVQGISEGIGAIYYAPNDSHSPR